MAKYPVLHISKRGPKCTVTEQIGEVEIANWRGMPEQFVPQVAELLRAKGLTAHCIARADGKFKSVVAEAHNATTDQHR